MQEPNDPDSPSSPAQPAEEIPDWVKNPLQPEQGTDASTPAAVTLAEKHKARRDNIHRLLTPAVEQPSGEVPGDEVPESVAEQPEGLDQPVQDASFQEMSLLDAVVQKARGFTQRLGQGARTLAQRFTRRAQPVPQEQITQEGPPAKQGKNVWRSNVWPRLRSFLWRGRIGPAFWTVASILSLVVNIILIVILILLGRQLFFIKDKVVSDQLINGLYDNFVLMDKAHIKTTITVSDTIQVKDTIPVVFDLPLSQETVVTLTESTPIKGATIYLNGQPVPLDLLLPQGTKLGINLNLTVPVNQTVPVVLNVPVNLQVPVDIALNQTELHQPFVGLRQVVSPFRKLLSDVPDSWGAVCKGPMKTACSVLRFK